MSGATIQQQRSGVPFAPVSAVHRVEGGAVAIAAAVLLVVEGFAWWWPLALFLAFDLSFAGYALGHRVGAMGYNAVHSYAAPALLLTAHAALLATGASWSAVALVAGCWLFHVGADRALGYGPRPLR